MAASADQDRAFDAASSFGKNDKAAARPGDIEITLLRDIAAIEPEWRRLERRDWNSLNQTLDWCRSWCAAHRSELIAITGSIGRRIVFILPLEIVPERFGRTARLPGGRFNNANTGLFDEALAIPDAADLARLRTDLAASLRGIADLVVLDQMPLNWRGQVNPLAGLASIENQNHAFQLPLHDTMEATLAQVNAKTRRKKFRTQTRRMEALGGFDYTVATEPQEQHELLDRFFVQKAARLQAFGLPDVFAAPETRDFLHSLLDIPAEGSDRLLTMHAIQMKGEHAGHIPAITGLSRKGGHVLCQFSSIDESIAAEASPGELLFWLAIEHSIRNGAALFDFGIGDQPYKRSWCSEETIQHDILLPVSWRGALFAPARLATTRIKSGIKKNPRLYAIAQRWRARHS
jgi:CelD/BcsL family acetyltransferase involved in cellulose biosynthesis